MQLKVLSHSNVEQARIWRNDNLSMNRTPFLLTQEMQGSFYQEVICNRNANARYWGILEKTIQEYAYEDGTDSTDEIGTDKFIGMGEITNISRENRNGEIGLIMHPGYVYMADEAISMILEQAFNCLNLENIYGEVYMCSAYYDIWVKSSMEHSASCCNLPNRKYWNGQYYDSLYFNINSKDWNKCKT
jgi:RimJ/RimL family protein N-acetyltransferase